jgi:excisionase family DNA binding protein
MTKNSSSSDRLLTTEEVAEIMRVPVATVRKWRSQRTGPHGFRVGKYVRYRRSAVDAFLDEKEAAE